MENPLEHLALYWPRGAKIVFLAAIVGGFLCIPAVFIAMALEWAGILMFGTDGFLPIWCVLALVAIPWAVGAVVDDPT